MYRFKYYIIYFLNFLMKNFIKMISFQIKIEIWILECKLQSLEKPIESIFEMKYVTNRCVNTFILINIHDY